MSRRQLDGGSKERRVSKGAVTQPRTDTSLDRLAPSQKLAAGTSHAIRARRLEWRPCQPRRGPRRRCRVWAAQAGWRCYSLQQPSRRLPGPGSCHPAAQALECQVPPTPTVFELTGAWDVHLSISRRALPGGWWRGRNCQPLPVARTASICQPPPYSCLLPILLRFPTLSRHPIPAEPCCGPWQCAQTRSERASAAVPFAALKIPYLMQVTSM